MINTAQHILWHTPQWEQVSQMRAQDRFAHALLLEGMQGVGKKVFAYQLAQMLLCQGESESGICHACASCGWFKAGTHPDFVVLQPEEGKKLIPVDAIRQVTQQIFKTSHQNAYRILLIEPADAMTLEAANSLLKTLEEPPPQTLLMLLTDKPARLLPTIRSRASRLSFRLPSPAQAISWLKEQGLDEDKARALLALSLGAPMRLSLQAEDIESVLSDSQVWWQEWRSLFSQNSDPIKMAKGWAQAEPGLFLAWLEKLLRELIHSAMLGGSQAATPTDALESVLFPGLQEFQGKFNCRALFQVRDNIVELSQQQQGSLNWGLQLEALVCDCQALG